MGAMARPQPSGTGAGRGVLLLAAAALVAGCQGSPREQPTPPPASAALRVHTVEGAGQLDEDTRTELETRVGDVLSRYVVGGFLGDFPREDFVTAFEPFTSNAARAATRDIDLLTAARLGDATDVRATRLDARLSFLVDGRDVVGATARVGFDFEATLADGGTRDLSLRGRLLLVEEDGTWSIFGYDVAHDDGADATRSTS